MLRTTPIVLALLLGAGNCLAQAPAAPGTTGGVRVRITWDGDLPAPRPFAIPADFKERRPDEAEFCGACAARGALRDESLEVEAASHGVRNVAASVLGVPGDPASLPAATLDNFECRFEPRVSFAAVGKTLTVKNSDTFAHNARIVGRGNQEFWNAILAPGKDGTTRPFVVAGTYAVVCDVHPWMKATVIAVKHPFCAITGPDGAAEMTGVPAGAEREIVLWHESLGTARTKVTVEAGKTAEVALTQKAFKAP